MKTIAIVNEKGGTGKTTTAVNLAAALGQAGHRTLLVDLDGQAASSRWLGVEEDNRLADALLRGGGLEPMHDVLPGVSLAPASGKLDSVSHDLRPTQGGQLRRVLAPLTADFEYVLIDCPPSLGNRLIGNALLAASHALVPVEPSILALDGLRMLLTTLDDVRHGFEHPIAMMGVVVCRFEPRTRLSRLVVAELNRALPGHVFQTHVRETIRIQECPASGQSIMQFAPSCSAARDYVALARELVAGGPAASADVEQAKADLLSVQELTGEDRQTVLSFRQKAADVLCNGRNVRRSSTQVEPDQANAPVNAEDQPDARTEPPPFEPAVSQAQKEMPAATEPRWDEAEPLCEEAEVQEASMVEPGQAEPALAPLEPKAPPVMEQHSDEPELPPSIWEPEAPRWSSPVRTRPSLSPEPEAQTPAQSRRRGKRWLVATAAGVLFVATLAAAFLLLATQSEPDVASARGHELAAAPTDQVRVQQGASASQSGARLQDDAGSPAAPKVLPDRSPAGDKAAAEPPDQPVAGEGTPQGVPAKAGMTEPTSPLAPPGPQPSEEPDKADENAATPAASGSPKKTPVGPATRPAEQPAPVSLGDVDMLGWRSVKVSAVLESSTNPLAIINGRIVGIGDRAGEGVIVGIGPAGVEISLNGQKIVVGVGQSRSLDPSSSQTAEGTGNGGTESNENATD